MRHVSFDIVDDWQSHPNLSQAVPWRTASGKLPVVFEAEVNGSRWAIRLNNFPDEPCHTVLIDGEEIMHFDDWPEIWIRPEYPKRDENHVA